MGSLWFCEWCNASVDGPCPDDCCPVRGTEPDFTDYEDECWACDGEPGADHTCGAFSTVGEEDDG